MIYELSEITKNVKVLQDKYERIVRENNLLKGKPKNGKNCFNLEKIKNDAILNCLQENTEKSVKQVASLLGISGRTLARWMVDCNYSKPSIRVERINKLLNSTKKTRNGHT